jgi:hypothetical protein
VLVLYRIRAGSLFQSEPQLLLGDSPPIMASVIRLTRSSGNDSFGIEDRANELSNSTQAYRRSSIGTGQAERRKLIHEAQAYSFRSRSQEVQPGAESAMGKEGNAERPSSRGTT